MHTTTILLDYESQKFLDLPNQQFLGWQRQTNPHKPITLPLAHVCRVNMLMTSFYDNCIKQHQVRYVRISIEVWINMWQISTVSNPQHFCYLLSMISQLYREAIKVQFTTACFTKLLANNQTKLMTKLN